VRGRIRRLELELFSASLIHRKYTMGLEEVIIILGVLIPIAEAVPVLGSSVKGSLEALSKILEFAQARLHAADQASFSLADL
jgi:hypothetical protein